MAEQNQIFPEGDLKQNRMYIENFDDFKEELGLTDLELSSICNNYPDLTITNANLYTMIEPVKTLLNRRVIR
jgi:hypothetical protein